MKRYIKPCKLWVLSSLAALTLLLALTGAGFAQSETPFQNFETWQQSGFHGMGARSFNEQGWAAFESSGANLARVFVSMFLTPGTDTYAIKSSVYPMMDSIVAQANRRNFKIAVTFHTAAKAPLMQFWVNEQMQASIVAVIRAFAARYAGNDAFAGFDIINEPGPIIIEPKSARDPAWQALATRIINAIRSEDPTRVIIFEWARWDADYTDLPPIPFKGVVYSSHWYMPNNLTHQGVYPEYSDVIPYPTPADNRFGPYNRAIMKQYLQPIRDFQVRYNVPIYFGEFSCARWAPGKSSYNFAADAVSIFNEFKWNWTFFTFRGYRGWDAELARGSDTDIRSANTDLMRYLKTQMLTLNR